MLAGLREFPGRRPGASPEKQNFGEAAAGMDRAGGCRRRPETF
jgi:hypothetical protein